MPRLDDIQDGSPLRRGQPAAHTLFGEAQTINSANLAIIEAIKAAGDVGVDGATRIILGELLLWSIQANNLNMNLQTSCRAFMSGKAMTYIGRGTTHAPPRTNIWPWLTRVCCAALTREPLLIIFLETGGLFRLLARLLMLVADDPRSGTE